MVFDYIIGRNPYIIEKYISVRFCVAPFQIN